MKVTAGKNSIMYNVSFEELDEPISCDNESYFGYGKPSLRIRFALWVFGFLAKGRRINGSNMINCSITGTNELREEQEKSLKEFLENSKSKLVKTVATQISDNIGRI